jgi:hypothetical protein
MIDWELIGWDKNDSKKGNITSYRDFRVYLFGHTRK